MSAAPLIPAPAPGLSACVVVPARDEEDRIGACLTALAGQLSVADTWEIIVVLDACTDRTPARVEALAAELPVPLQAVRGPGEGAGAARRLGMDLACERLHAVGRPDGLIASTDADTVVAPDWLARQLGLAGAGARAIGGLVELHPAEGAALHPAATQARTDRAEERLDRVRADDPTAEHHHFAGASLAVTAAAYRHVGGLEPVAVLEDEGLARRLQAHHIPIVRSRAVRVQTSARTDGRAGRGLAVDLARADWLARRRYDAQAFAPSELRAAKGPQRVAVVLPTRNVAATVGGVITRTIGPAMAAGLVDEVLVVDAASADGTGAAARAAGAVVLQQDDLLPAFGPALGKGDAMWRALSATDADILCYLDADTEDPHPHHLLGLLGPLLTDPDVVFVKGAFDRPFRAGDRVMEGEGGRVTELTARPLIALHAPALGGFRQPLAGEIGARRDVLRRIPFPAGYGVEIAMLLDVWRDVGLDAMAESWLGRRQNRHQPLSDLSAMAYAVLVAVQQRVQPGAPTPSRYERLDDERPREVPVLERPPLDALDDLGDRPGLLTAAGGAAERP